MKHDFSLNTVRLNIKPLKDKDIELLRILRNRAENRICFVSSGVISKKNQEQWFEKYLNKRNDIMFSIFLNDNDSWIGAGALYNVNMDKNEAEFGRIIIDKKIIGTERGIGTEAIKAICDIGFNEMQLGIIKLEVFKKNISAIKAYKKVGFVISGEIQDNVGQEMYCMTLKK